MSLSHSASKLRAQISLFLGKVCVGLSKPLHKFVEEMVYGITARQSVLLSEVVRSLEESIAFIKTENRLSRNLACRHLGDYLNQALSRLYAPRIKQRDLLILDPSDITKKYAEKMEHLGRVRDGSEGVIHNGYHTIHAIGLSDHKPLPLYSQLYSTSAEDHQSENDEIIRCIRHVSAHTDHKGIWVMDRGADRGVLFKYLIEQQQQFIIRLQQMRYLYTPGKLELVEKKDPKHMRFTKKVVVKRMGDEVLKQLHYDITQVRLKAHPDTKLYLIEVHGFGQEPMRLLTNAALSRKQKEADFIIESYIKRWTIEETIRFMKQNYQLEDVRVLTYKRLQNLMAIVNVAMAFIMAEMSLKDKLSVLVQKTITAAKTIFDPAKFHYYAIATGMSEIFRRHPRKNKKKCIKQPEKQLSLFPI